MGAPGIGLKQAFRLTGMERKDRLVFFAEGLPTMLTSARGLWNAAKRLEDSRREADVLIGLAKEEAGKLLIVMDIVLEALSAVGAFSEVGLSIVATVWGDVDFSVKEREPNRHPQQFAEFDRLVRAVLGQLIATKLHAGFDAGTCERSHMITE